MGKPVSHSPVRYVLWVLLALVSSGLAAVLSGTQAPPDTAHNTLNRAKPMAVTSENLILGNNAKPAIQNNSSGMKTDELQRVEPRAPLSAIAVPVLPPPPIAAKDLPRRWRPMGNGFASAAGIVQVGTVSITLEGLDTLTANDTCIAPSGEVWPCGMVARTAFRAFLRARTLNCAVPDGLIDRAISAECLLAGDDPAKWLVQNGWARASATGPYGSEGDHAKANGTGMFGSPPR